MAAAHGYIGRSPGDSATVIARQSFSPTGIQTDFTFAAGYSVGYVDLYLNGARLIEGQDFTATDGSTVGLTTNAVNGDVLEVVAFKAFNATNVSAASGNFTVSENLTVSGTAEVTGAITATGGVVGDVTGNATGLSGTPDLTIRNLTGVAATFTGIVSYDDVVNVDSVGIITARSHVSIADSILHTGDTDTSIRFPSAGTFTINTDGSERLRVNSSGNVGINSTGQIRQLEIYHGTHATASLNSETQSSLFFSKPTDANIGQISYDHGSDFMYFRVNDGERVRITSNGNVGIGTNNASPGRLTVNNVDSASTPTLDLRAPQNERIIRFKNNAGGDGSLFVDGTSNTIDYKFNTYSAMALYIKNDGKIGIGTTIPGGKLQIDGGELLVGTKTVKAVASTTNATAIFRDDGGAHTLIAVESSAASGGGTLALSANRNNSDSGFTIVQDNDVLGEVRFAGSDGTDLQTYGARIRSIVDGTPAANNMPGRLEFHTNSGGATTVERLRISANGMVALRANQGTAETNILRFEDTDTSVTANQKFGQLQWFSNDASGGGPCVKGQIYVAATDTTPDGHMVFETHDGSGTEPAERMRIVSSGQIGIGTHTPQGNLEVYDNDGLCSVVIQTIAASDAELEFRNSNGGNGTWAIGLDYSDSKKFKIAHKAAMGASLSTDEVVSIDSSGNAAFDGTVSDSKGDLRKIIYKQETSAYTLVAADAGKAIEIQGNLTVPNSVFAAGDAITIINDSSSDKTISKGTGLSYMFNTADGTNANRTLGARGMATIYFVNSTTCYISGSRLS